MTPDIVLQKAIQKAIGNGYDIGYHSVTSHMVDNDPYTIIFSHDFAKAFWGENLICPACEKEGEEGLSCGIDRSMRLPAWQYHIQETVLSDDPFEYLQKFL